MARHIFVVFSEPSEGREDEFNEWYSERHIFDLLKVPGITGATRYVLTATDEPNRSPAGHRYLALYEIEADDIADVRAGIRALRASGEMPVSDSIKKNTKTGYFTQIASTH